MPRRGWQRPQSYESLRPGLDALSNALAEIEVDVPFDLMPQPADAGDSAAMSALASIGSSLYFSVPRNDQLPRYWDTVADRLFKIRNSLNIQGVFRQLPLFEPPIDPALLAKAAAAGLDVTAVIAGLNQPVPLVRFGLLAQKASEICQQVMALGNQLLAVIEKEDGEALGLLRAQHETAILRLGEHVRYQQYQEASKSRDAVGAYVAIVPDIEASAKPMGVGAGVRFGGTNLSNAIAAGSAVARTVSSHLNYEAGLAGKIGSYDRREQDWALQSNIALGEISQIYKQWRAAQIREATAEREWQNH